MSFPDPEVAAPGAGMFERAEEKELRPRAAGKFFYLGDQKFYLRGVTYGPFRIDDSGSEYGSPDRVAKDFATMKARGFNAVRVYTVPPRWLLDLALERGLYVMVGLPWEQHIAFLDDRKRADAIAAGVTRGVEACAGHPAVLSFAIGNEIPSPIVRWHGSRRVERFLKRLYDGAKNVDPEALVTYVNYPTTEYLNLPFLDFQCFNLYLETQNQLDSYLARLQNLAGDSPLVMGEIGLDSRRNGENRQAEVLDWQVRTAFAAGCAGSFMFAWTDEWHRGGHDIEDWDFGLTRRDRSPKPALESVADAFDDVPISDADHFPSFSVVICSYNGAATIRQSLEGVARLDYPNYEVIVVDDGSKDETAAIAAEFDCRVITTPNRGLSAARNTGSAAASGEIVVYLDDDAYPDPDWLKYLGHTFATTDFAAAGGPNIRPPESGLIASCVDNAPGGPTHVLIDDRTAEHVPGCNLAVRKDALEKVGGFDEQFRIAGDDVDLCWKLHERGWKIGFSPAAMVWHHRRKSVLTYLKQQSNYGKAEAMLERKWPEKYNVAGHVSWTGRIYGNGAVDSLFLPRGRIYHGTWGLAPFQRIYEQSHGKYSWIPAMPEAFLVIGFLAFLTLGGIAWPPLFLFLPLLAAACGIAVAQAGRAAFRAENGRQTPVKARVVIFALHLLQPLVRLAGRLKEGLSPWRPRGLDGVSVPLPAKVNIWSEQWDASDAWLHRLEEIIAGSGIRAERGGNFDRWDLRISGGLLGGAILRMGVEDHGGGKQYLRFLTSPDVRIRILLPLIVLVSLASAALYDGALGTGIGLAVLALALLGRGLWESGRAMNGFLSSLRTLREQTEAAIADA